MSCESIKLKFMKRTVITSIVGLLVILVVIWLVLVKLNQNATIEDNAGNNNNQSAENSSQVESRLKDGTQTYTSDKLGLTFTYDPKPSESFDVKVTEKDNKVYLYGSNETPEQGKVIEMFTKESDQSLKDAIQTKLLARTNPADCFVADIQRSPQDPRPLTFQFSEISYPAPDDPSAPFWQNSTKCPQAYAKTNAVQYFMMDSAYPDKFYFLKLGQDSITSDGREAADDGSRQDWSSSIRIN